MRRHGAGPRAGVGGAAAKTVRRDPTAHLARLRAPELIPDAEAPKKLRWTRLLRATWVFGKPKPRNPGIGALQPARISSGSLRDVKWEKGQVARACLQA